MKHFGDTSVCDPLCFHKKVQSLTTSQNNIGEIVSLVCCWCPVSGVYIFDISLRIVKELVTFPNVNSNTDKSKSNMQIHLYTCTSFYYL